MASEEAIRITAEEVNCLIYSYFKDSGFNHSAFTLRNEGRLQNSPHFGKHIPRGELVELLSKALLYLEMESHWRGDSITTNCKTGFSLLEPHVCSVDAQAVKSAPVVSNVSNPDAMPTSTEQPREPIQPAKTVVSRVLEEATSSAISAKEVPLPTTAGAPVPEGKRKVSPVTIDAPAEKRAKHDSDAMDVDAPLESNKPKTPAPSVPTPAPSAVTTTDVQTKKPTKLKIRTQGPGDDVTNPKSILMLPGHKTEVFVCAFNPVKHGILATGSKDSVVNLWNLPDAANKDEFAPAPRAPITLNLEKPEQGDLTSLHWNSDGTLLAIGSYDAIIRIATFDGKIYFSHTQHKAPIFAAKFSKSGRWLVTASLDGTSCLWDVWEKCLVRQYRCHTDCCLDVDWLNETTFASAGADQRIHILRVDEANPIKTFHEHQNEINQIKVNPRGTRLASCSDDMTARVWNVEHITADETIPGLSASEHSIVLEGHKHSVSTIGWCPASPTGLNELLATSSFDGTARLWDSVTGECLKIFADHKRPVYALSFSPNGRWMATGSADGWMYIYDVMTREKKWSWYAGVEKPGVFEFDWQSYAGTYRLALALECRQVGIIDTSKIPALQSDITHGTGKKELLLSPISRSKP
ncbi:WD40-repeat-containing domain protein [Cyathus striatus]|nr:WD40-repeat-containing domain protein [Cyathus striatus]